MSVFIDSNIPMYVAGRERANRDPSRRLLQRIRDGDLEACSSTEVLQEILYRYASLNRLDLAAQVYDLFVRICPLIHPITLADTDRARLILCGSGIRGVSARDAVHAAVMLNHDVEYIATFDTGFDAIPGIERFVFS